MINKGKRASILTGIEDLERHETDREVKEREGQELVSEKSENVDSDDVDASDAEDFIDTGSEKLSFEFG
jgi:hypothetical protein